MLTRHKGVEGFRSALLRYELAWDGARGFRIDIRCLGVILMTWECCRQVGIGRRGVSMVMVMTVCQKPVATGPSAVLDWSFERLVATSSVASCLQIGQKDWTGLDFKTLGWCDAFLSMCVSFQICGYASF